MTNPKDLVEEKTHIKQALHWNGYLAWLLEGADMPPPDQSAEEEVEENSLDPASLQLGPSDPAETTVVELPVPEKTKKSYPVVITYVKGVSEKVRRVMRGYGVKVYFKSSNILRQILMQTKDKIIKERVVCPIYNTSCDNCNDSYMRETGSSLKATFV